MVDIFPKMCKVRNWRIQPPITQFQPRIKVLHIRGMKMYNINSKILMVSLLFITKCPLNIKFSRSNKSTGFHAEHAYKSKVRSALESSKNWPMVITSFGHGLTHEEQLFQVASLINHWNSNSVWGEMEGVPIKECLHPTINKVMFERMLKGLHFKIHLLPSKIKFSK